MQYETVICVRVCACVPLAQGTTSEQQVNNKWTTSEQLVNNYCNNNYNKDNNYNNYKYT